MRIALLTDGIYPYAMGGMQKHSYYLAKYFAQQKVQVHLYHFSQNKTYDIQQLEFFTDNEKGFIQSFIIPFPSLGKLPGHYLRESYQYSVNIHNALKKNADVDFIYAQGYTGWKIMEAKKAGEKIPPIGVNFHGIEPFQKAPSLKAKLQQQILKGAMLYNLKHADVVFSLGGNLTSILLKNKIEKNKIVQIPIGIEQDWVHTSMPKNNDVIKFVFVGRYERRKGIEELNKALLKILDKENFEFHFIGPIPENKKIISPKIIYYGSIGEQEKIKNILRSCDVLVCASYSEGMPTVILEAMASGLTVIATNVGAVNELVSDKTGYLIPSARVSVIVDALKNAIHEQPEKLEQKKRNGQQLIHENFMWDKIIGLTLSEIKKKI